MSKKIIAIALIALSHALVNCKDNSTTDPEPAKTLNKSLITDKYWSDGSSGFYLRKDGKSCGTDGVDVFGTWQWLNNSDSLEIIDFGTGTEIWYIKYCTEAEMSAKLGFRGSYLLFTKK